MISVEKPGSPVEVLAHFGKKGMRWGIRKKQESSGQREKDRGKAYVSHLTHEQWQTKIESQRRMYRQLDEVSRSSYTTGVPFPVPWEKRK